MNSMDSSLARISHGMALLILARKYWLYADKCGMNHLNGQD